MSCCLPCCCFFTDNFTDGLGTFARRNDDVTQNVDVDEAAVAAVAAVGAAEAGLGT